MFVEFSDKRRSSLLRDASVTRRVQLTPKAKRLYSEAVKLRRRTERLQKKAMSFKQRLVAAEKYSETREFGRMLENVNEVTRDFVMCQVRAQGKKSRGRRFTMTDKIFALSLFKQSGRGYNLLSKMFALPSRKTLRKLLQRIPFLCGINKRIFENLKQSVSKLNPLDRYCTVIFDEISLSPGLQYEQSKDVIIGFEDLGTDCRKSVFADHAVVFMVRGIRKKFKQPVAYMLCETGMKTNSLAVTIKEIVRAVRSTGLEVVATVCDQAAANVAAINYLKNETKIQLRGNEERIFGFLVDDVEVVPLFDTPHLLKGIRNNLLEKNAEFTVDGVKKLAKWEHIEQLYTLDCSSGDQYKVCPRLTDQHVVKGKIKKMKVSFAAQVFSQRVSAVLRRLASWSGMYLFIIL